jgi:hypothetical protein
VGTGQNSSTAAESDLHSMKRNHNRQTGARACEHRKHLVEIPEKEPRRQDKISQRAQDCAQSHAPALAAVKYNSTTTRPIDA